MKEGRVRVLTALAVALLVGCAAPEAEPEQAAEAEDPQLVSARAAWENTPTDADSIIWYGRRVGYTGAFADAVAIYSEGLRHHPDEPRLLRHRGHRYVSLREFPNAIADLERARAVAAGQPDEVEPDGQPNARGIPTSTLHSNIRYHLALAHYVTGDFAAALPIWREDAELAKNLDQRVASTYWWVLTLGQLGRHEEARAVLEPILADWDIIENGSYHRLLLWMKCDLAEADLLPADASALERQTIGNGIGQWHRAHGRLDEARRAFDAVLASGPSASFGFIAAEQALEQLGPAGG
jgi:tetratricopeptide (TPR) repeat protein